MTVLIWLLTPILVLDCLFLGLLILVQLPKKEAGMGMAFGGGAADALFGAGSGTALTKMTKYSAGIFFGLVLMLSLLNIHSTGRSDVGERLSKLPLPAASQAVPQGIPASTDTNVTINLPTNLSNNVRLEEVPVVTNVPAVTNTNK